MKTIVRNLLTLSAAIVLTVSVMAQNTKSIHYAVYTVESNHKVSARADKLIQKLSTEVANLKSLIKYIPASHNEEIQMETTDEMNLIQEQLMEYAKYVPSQDVKELEEGQYQVNMDSILRELEKDAKFRPATEEMEDLQVAVAELSEYARFQPSNEF